jgi:hypothetical protein
LVNLFHALISPKMGREFRGTFRLLFIARSLEMFDRGTPRPEKLRDLEPMAVGNSPLSAQQAQGRGKRSKAGNQQVPRATNERCVTLTPIGTIQKHVTQLRQRRVCNAFWDQ